MLRVRQLLTTWRRVVLVVCTADYVVPGAPATDSSQVLFYFIGTENIRSTTDLSILQPGTCFCKQWWGTSTLWGGQ